ncbi:MAG TPA: DHHA1 domain-containing protein [Gemmatimonadales bacterium]|nr:DHHA1 domain-containing protein [Gemmatimonadales bacterium]
MNDTPLIAHHASCPDGMTAAWWLRRNLPEEWGLAELMPVSYGPPAQVEACAGRRVFVVDFCFPAAELDAIAAVAMSLVVMDHHHTAEALLAESSLTMFGSIAEWGEHDVELAWDTPVAILDQYRSGAGIVAEWVAVTSGVRPPAFVVNVEDRDLWKFTLPDTEAVSAAIGSYPYEISAWDALAEMRHDEIVDQGKAISRYRKQMIQAVAASTFQVNIAGHQVPCVTSPYMIGSDVADVLANQNPEGIAAYCIFHADEVQVGLRSRGGADVAAMAEQYRGGGHKAASGFRVPWAQWFEMCGKMTPEDCHETLQSITGVVD